jgi:DNA-binding GntR family transcriptional regulator
MRKSTPRLRRHSASNSPETELAELPVTVPVFASRSVSQQIGDYLRSAIVQGSLKPNQRLVEEAIAGQLGVSRTPVREALRRLEAEGLVIYTPQRGAIVRQVSTAELAEVYDLRILLECYAARTAAERIQPSDLGQLEQLCDAFETALQDRRPRGEQVRELMTLNDEFHSAIIRICGNQRLARFMNMTLGSTMIYGIYYYFDEGKSRIAAREHRQIVAALRAGNAARAETLMQEHLARARDLIFEAMEKIGAALPTSD